MWYPTLGFAVAAAASWVGRVDLRVFRGSVASSLFSGLLTFSALLASVLLGLLAIIASLDARPLVQEIKKNGHYPELVTAAYTPLRSFIVLSTVTLAALLFDNADSEAVRRATASLSFALAASGILSTLRFARLLVRVMIDPADGARPTKNMPAAARARAASDREPVGIEEPR